MIDFIKSLKLFINNSGYNSNCNRAKRIWTLTNINNKNFIVELYNYILLKWSRSNLIKNENLNLNNTNIFLYIYIYIIIIIIISISIQL